MTKIDQAYYAVRLRTSRSLWDDTRGNAALDNIHRRLKNGIGNAILDDPSLEDMRYREVSYAGLKPLRLMIRSLMKRALP